MTIDARPLSFHPIYKETIWGGHSLRRRFNRPIEADRVVGESWEIVSHGPNQSVVASGPLAGETLGSLVGKYGTTLTGPTAAAGTFPLLAKFIDASDRLSVQVHPDDRQARSWGWGEFGKTECWYIIDAPRNGRVIAGLKSPVTRTEICHAIETSSLDTLLDEIPIRPGDIVFLPAGTVHAILEGTLLFEIQETSDATLRLYDWGRVDASGNPRPLHVRDALNVLDTESRPEKVIPPVSYESNGVLCSLRVACRYFAIEEYRFDRATEIILTAKRSFRIVTVLSGHLVLKYPCGSSEYGAGATVLLPALMRDIRAIGSGGTTVLVSSVPDLQTEIISPLLAKGIPRTDILGLGGATRYNDLLPFLG